MRLLILLSLAAAVALPVSAQQDEDPNEWVIEYHQFPEPALIEGFTSPQLGFLKAPELPAEDAPDEEVLKFVKQSNEIVSHFFEYIGVSSPKGVAFLFDPETGTLAARLPRGAQIAIANLAEAARDRVPKYIAADLTIIESAAARIRQSILDAAETANHREVLDALLEDVNNGDASIAGALTQEAKSGQRAKITKQTELAIPTQLGADEDDWIEWESEALPIGLTWEIDPVIGADGLTIDFVVNFDFDYAPPRKRQAPISKRGETSLSAAVVDLHRAVASTAITTRSGDAKLVGVWKPESVDGRNDDTLQAAFVEGAIVPVLPLPNLRVQQLLTNLGDEISEIPDGPPQYAELPGELPPGMIVRRFVVPPGFLSRDPRADSGPVDPFADLSAGEPRFSIRATAKDILERVGIPFPDGSSANYIASTSELVIRNLPENVQLVEAYLSSLRESVPKTIGVSLHVVQAPAALLRRLTRESRTWSDHTPAWEELQNAADQGQATILRSVWCEGRSGQRFKVESGQHHVYNAAAWVSQKGRSAKNPAAAGQGDKPVAQAQAVVGGEGAWMSGAPETVVVGTVMEVDPVIGADGRTIDVNLNFNHHYAPPVLEGEAGRDAAGNVELDAPGTSFRFAQVTSSATMLSGAIRILGTWKPEGTAEFDQADLLQAVLLKVDVLEFPED